MLKRGKRYQLEGTIRGHDPKMEEPHSLTARSGIGCIGVIIKRIWQQNNSRCYYITSPLVPTARATPSGTSFPNKLFVR